MNELHELKEILCDELKEYGHKGKLSAGDLDIVDKLSHTVKNLNKIMEEYSGYSESRYSNDYYSSARRRDSMGRYSRDNHMMINELKNLMNDAPDERTRMEFKTFIDKMERM